MLVDALLYSLPLLMNTLIVCAFYFMIFGIVGLQVRGPREQCRWLSCDADASPVLTYLLHVACPAAVGWSFPQAMP